MDNSSPIKEFFQGTHVLITGATGFFGKSLTEKLTRSCPGIKKLYLLIRPKKGSDPKERLEKLLEDVVFRRLKEESPNFKEKITLISGDCSLPGLGLSKKDLETICENVNIVYHAAANVRFDMDLKTAIDINVGGTIEILKISKQIRNLKCFTYVSTLYSYCTEELVEERFYPPPKCSDRIMKMTSLLSSEELQSIAPKLLENWPNSYLFSKAIAENIVKQEEGLMPICVVRPAIVLSAMEEPMPGWMDNIYGPMATFLGISMGVLKVCYANLDAKHNCVPIDTVTNCAIAASHQSHKKYESGERKIDIFNFGSANVNPGKTWKDFHSMRDYMKPLAPLSAVWCMDYINVNNRFLFWFLSIFMHLIPALLVDAALLITGKKPRLFRLMLKATKLQDTLRRFSLTSYKMTDDNVSHLWKGCSESDRELFPFDLSSADWENAYMNGYRGLREFILKEPWDNLPQAQARQKRFRLMQRLIITLLFVFIVWCLL